MNSKLRAEILKLIEESYSLGLDKAIPDMDNLNEAEKAIRKAVAKDMLELVGEDDPFEQYLTSSKKSVGRQLKNKNRNDFRAELRQKIKEWAAPKETSNEA